MIFADRTLAQKIERTEARSNADFVESRTRMFPESGAEWIQVAGVYALFDGAESPLTQTFGLGVFDEITEKELDELEAFFRKHDAPVFHEVSPLADSSLIALLNARNYQPFELTNVMFQPLAREKKLDLPTNSLITTRIIEKGEEKLWAQTSADGWATEMPELTDYMRQFGEIGAHCDGGFPFLAELGGRAIASGMLFIYDGAAILGGASTVPEGRRNGAQSALLDARLRFAAETAVKLQ